MQRNDWKRRKRTLKYYLQNENYFDRLKQKRKEDIPLEIKGQIEDIIFQNEINGYTICTLQTNEDELITAVGYLPFMHSGDTVKLKALSIEDISYPTSRIDIEKIY